MPLAALITNGLIGDGIISSSPSPFSLADNNRKKSIWDVKTIADQMQARVTNGGVGIN